jgi:hypothetical protein
MMRQFAVRAAEAAGRRGFLESTGAAALALVATVLGLPRNASASCVEAACCCLCSASAPSCPPTGSSCACQWAWPCVVDQGCGVCTLYSCFECYNTNFTNCDTANGCPTGKVLCSKAKVVHSGGC